MDDQSSLPLSALFPPSLPTSLSPFSPSCAHVKMYPASFASQNLPVTPVKSGGTHLDQFSSRIEN